MICGGVNVAYMVCLPLYNLPVLSLDSDIQRRDAMCNEKLQLLLHSALHKCINAL